MGVDKELIQGAGEIVISNNYRLSSAPHESIMKGIAVVPAIAIPIETDKVFECPMEHLDCLKALLPSTKKIIIVGWSGTDFHFLKLLEEALSHEVPTLVIAANKTDAQQVIALLKTKNVQVSATHSEGGFTDSVKQRQVEEFLAT